VYSPESGISLPCNRGDGCRRSTFLPPHFWSALPLGRSHESVMSKLLVAAVIGGLFVSLQAKAQERAGSAALGAVSGAVVLGPVGAVAGAFIGYAAGPSIARSWGIGHSATRAHARRVTEASAGAQAASTTPLPVAKPAAAIVAGKSTPPVQGFD
jgi:Bacteriocin class II with double-glycine leader peptide